MTNDERARYLEPQDGSLPEGARFDFAMSPTIGKLAASMAKAQAKMLPAFKEALNPHTGKYYATLASCTQALKPMHDEGLAVFQPPLIAPQGYVRCQTLVVHGESGEWIRGVLDMPIVAQVKRDGTVLPIDAQSYGSSLSYCRRYSLSSTVLLATSDDDAETTAQQGREAAQTAPAKPAANGAPKSQAKPPVKTQAPKQQAAPPKQEAPPEPETEEPPPPEAAKQEQQAAGEVAKLIHHVNTTTTPDQLAAIWAHREKIDASAHKMLWETIASRVIDLMPDCEDADLTAYNKLIVALGKPDALQRAYVARYQEWKKSREAQATQ